MLASARPTIGFAVLLHARRPSASLAAARRGYDEAAAGARCKVLVVSARARSVMAYDCAATRMMNGGSRAHVVYTHAHTTIGATILVLDRTNERDRGRRPIGDRRSTHDASTRRLFVARDDKTMRSPRRSSPSRHDSTEPKLLVWGSAARAEPSCWRSDTAVSLLSVALASSSAGVYRRRRSHVSHLAYVIVGRLDFLDIWPLYPSLGHRTVHRSSGCTYLVASLVGHSTE